MLTPLFGEFFIIFHCLLEKNLHYQITYTQFFGGDMENKILETEKVEKLFPFKKEADNEKPFRYVYQIHKLPEKFLAYRKLSSMIPQQKPKREVNQVSGKTLFFVPAGEKIKQEKPLSPDRVKSWRLKVYLLASERLKKVDAKKDMRCGCKVTLINRKVETKEVPWQELLKPYEERQFQITRLTKILSD